MNLRPSTQTQKTQSSRWDQLVKSGTFNSFAELRNEFPSADQVDHLTVFNIGGKKVRLIAAIHYNRQKLYIRAVLIHATIEGNGESKNVEH